MIYQDAPICFVEAIDINSQLKGRSYGEIGEGIQCDRRCDSWVKWRPGYSPKEHLEMIQLEELRKQQREEAERNRAFQAEQARDQREQQRLQRRHQWLTLLATFAGLALAIYKAKEPSAAPVVNVLVPRSADVTSVPPAEPITAEPTPSVYQKALEPVVTQEPAPTQDEPANKPNDEPMGD